MRATAAVCGWFRKDCDSSDCMSSCAFRAKRLLLCLNGYTCWATGLAAADRRYSVCESTEKSKLPGDRISLAFAPERIDWETSRSYRGKESCELFKRFFMSIFFWPLFRVLAFLGLGAYLLVNESWRARNFSSSASKSYVPSKIYFAIVFTSDKPSGTNLRIRSGS